MTTQQDAAPKVARSAPPRASMRPHLVTLVSVLATTTSAWAVNPLLAPGRWALVAFVACLALAWGTAWLRTWMRSAVAPTLIGFAVVAYGLTIAYLSPAHGIDLLPDADTIERLGLLAEHTSATIVANAAPLEITAGIEAAAIGGICATYLLVELCAFGWRAPAWSAVPLLTLWAPSIVVYIEVSALSFLLAAVSYLVLVGLATGTTAVDAAERQRHSAIVTAWSLALVVVTLVVTPLVLLAPGWGTNPLPFLGSGGGALLLSDEIDMRQDLGRQSNEVALRYHVAPSTVGALRLRTMHEFDGTTWQLDEEAGEQRRMGADTLLWSEEVAPEILDGRESLVDVEIVGLRENRLPIPTFPRSVEAAGRWTYDVGRDEVISRQRTSPGERYSFRTTTDGITSELLRAAGRGSPERESEYLALPSTEHLEDVARRAREVTADADNAYDQALLLQTYLRSPPFEYTTTVPVPVTGDAVWDFLESGRGYCVQSATAMVVMARTLGIPARMALGFLPGSALAGSPRTFEVRGDRAHTWPELHFDGIGWVRFEPTPAAQSGLPPAYADPFANTGEGPTPEPELPIGTPVPTAVPTAGPAPGGGGIVRTLSSVPGWLVAVGVVAVLVLVTAVALLVHRARRRAGERLAPESAWRQLRDRLGALEITWTDSATPRRAAGEIRRQLARRTRTPLGPQAQDGLAVLVRSVEADRYSPRGADVTAEELEAAVAAVVSDVTSISNEARAATTR